MYETDGSEGVTTLRVVSYNIHWGIGMDGERALRRIADVIDRLEPDLVGIQEVDRNRRPKTDYEDQLSLLREYLDVNAAYGVTIAKEPTADSGGEPRQYGIATLTPHEIVDTTTHELTHVDGAEQRVLLESRVDVDGVEVPLFNTHLGLTPEERAQQAADILELTGDSDEHVLVGDFNARPESQPVQTLTDRYTDVLAATDNAAPTFPSPYVDTDEGAKYTDSYDAVYTPDRRIDYVFATDGVDPHDGRVAHSLASDHSPVVAELTLPADD